MKKLFLASVVANVMDEFIKILPVSSEKLAVVFISNAADPYKDKWFVDTDRNKLKEKGFAVKDIDLRGKTEPELREETKNADIIFVAGGNTFYLLEKVKESGFDKVVKDFVAEGKLYVGSSAGAIIACPDIGFIGSLDDPLQASSLKSFEALSLVDFLVVPHFGKKGEEDKQDEIMKKHAGKEYDIIGITDEQAIVVENGNYKIVGN